MYEVSNTGNVRSVDRQVSTNIKFNTSRIIKGKTLNMNLKHTGYYSVDLCKNGKVKTESVHRLVAIAFIPNPNSSKVVNHINGIKTDNRVENLEWVSYKDNHWHARENNLLVNIGQCYLFFRCWRSARLWRISLLLSFWHERDDAIYRGFSSALLEIFDSLAICELLARTVNRILPISCTRFEKIHRCRKHIRPHRLICSYHERVPEGNCRR